MIQKLKKIPKKQEKIFKESDVAVLLENLNDNIKIVAEGQTSLRAEMHQEIGGLRTEMNTKIESEIGGLRAEMNTKIESEIGGLREEMNTKIESEIGGLRAEMRDSFKSILQYLSRIEDEVMEIKEEIRELREKKLDKEKFFVLEDQFGAMRKDIRECQTFLKIK